MAAVDDVLEIVNRGGVMLEQKAWKIVGQRQSIRNPKLGWSRNKVFVLGDKEFEYDILLETEKYTALMECKKTQYSWIFSQEHLDPKIFHVMRVWHPEFQNQIHVRSPSIDAAETAYPSIAVMFGSQGEVLRVNKKDVRVAPSDIDDALRQVCSLIGGLMDVRVLKAKPIIPVVITNAPLHVLKYNDSDIDDRADLKKGEMVEVGWLVANYNQEIKYQSGNVVCDDSTKSIVVVNIKALTEMLNHLDLFIGVSSD